MHKSWLTCILGIFTVFLGACGSGNPLSLGSIYFPVNVGDVRNFERSGNGTTAQFMQTVDAETPVNGNSVFPFTTVDVMGNTTRVDYFGANTSDGIRVCGWEDLENGASSQYTPCVFFPYLNDGATNSETVQVQGGGSLAGVTTFNYVFTVVNFGTVTVPAGIFQNCATNTVDAVNNDSAGNIVEQGLITIVLCPGVGIASLTTQNFSFGGGTSVLTSATIAGTNIP